MELMKAIGSYWDARAASYTDVIHKNLEGQWESAWAQALISRFPEGEKLKILDMGTGPGFYAIILAKRGYDVTAVDYSPGMLAQAKHNAGILAERITFVQADAREIPCPDESFDAIVTRNLTWNLPKPESAYAEWYRLLKKGGVLLNFDANWYAYLFDEEKKAQFDACRVNTRLAGVEDHESYAHGDIMEDISRQLPLGKIERPQWDIAVLKQIGFSRVEADTEAGQKLWNPEEKINYASTPGFLICAVK